MNKFQHIHNYNFAILNICHSFVWPLQKMLFLLSSLRITPCFMQKKNKPKQEYRIDSYALCLVVLSKQIPSFSPARFHTTRRKSLIILLKVIWNHNNQTIIGFLTAMVFCIVSGLWPFTFYNYFPICQLGKIWFCCHITQTKDLWHPF